MKLIAISRLRQDANRYPDVKKQVENWYKVVKNAQWNNLEEVKKIYKKAEAVGNFTIFNLKGNHYRLIVGMNYEAQVIYYKYLLTHSEYDQDKWKNDPYF